MSEVNVLSKAEQLQSGYLEASLDLVAQNCDATDYISLATDYISLGQGLSSHSTAELAGDVRSPVLSFLNLLLCLKVLTTFFFYLQINPW